ncbi:ribonuclease H2, subunit C [Xylariales sp. PMI_506]|nr:ribonuclease H2, subunit C [Xylariales sp. PMI_506]
MSQPILSVPAKELNAQKAQLHLLPCRIHHDGNVDPTESFWRPTEDKEGTKTAYFRGRKFHGKTVNLPEGYQGSVVEKGETKREIPQEGEFSIDDDVQELPDAIEIAPLNGKAQFDSFTVWGHESTADASSDAYVRSIEEWVTFAEQMHSYSAP